MPPLPRYLYLLMVLAAACNGPADTKTGKSNAKETVVDGDRTIKKYYGPDGALDKEITYENGIRKGLSREFYKNGKVFQEVNYDNNQREGLARRYYETGVLSQETPYANDTIHGIQKRYRRTGELMAEIPYHEGHLCIGLKEYSLEGKLKVQYPSIVITPVDHTLLNDTYILKVSLSDGSKHGVEYFLDKLHDGKYIKDSAEKIEATNGVGEIKYAAPHGTFLMKQISVIAKVKTALGNYYITQRTYNLSIESR